MLDANVGLLLSGGMDSAALAWWRRPAHAVTIDYGQLPAQAELRAARQICAELGIRHHVLAIDCRCLGTGDMVGQPNLEVAPTPEWWPFRNQMLITFAAAHLLRFGVRRLLIGTLATDAANGDGTTSFVTAMDRLLSMQEGGMSLVAPAINLDASALLVTSGVPAELLGWTHSCHVANHACGHCRGCGKRFATMKTLD